MLKQRWPQLAPHVNTTAHFPPAKAVVGWEKVCSKSLSTKATAAQDMYGATINSVDAVNGWATTTQTHPTILHPNHNNLNTAAVAEAEVVTTAAVDTEELNALRQAARRYQAKRFDNNNNNLLSSQLQQQRRRLQYQARMSCCKCWRETSNN